MARRSVNASSRNGNDLSVPLLQPDSQETILDEAFPATVEERKLFKCPTWCRPFSRNVKEMNVEDRMNLNWVQKWLKYGRFPWKFIFHALLTAACTGMVFLQTNDQTTYVVGMDATWYHVYFPDDFDYQGDFGDNSYYFYNIDDVVDSIRYAIIQHQEFPSTSVVPFKITPIGSSLVQMTVRSYRDCNKVYDPSGLNLNIVIDKTVYYVTPDDLGPLNNLTGDPLRNFFHCMQTISLEFGYNSVHLQYNHPLEYQLDIELLYDNSVQGGRIGLSLSWTKESLTNLPYVELLQLYKAMLDLAIIFFALMSQILSWVSIGKSFQLFASARRRLSRRDLFTSINVSSSSTPLREITWGRLPLRTKLRFFNMWFVITILGNLANICAALLDFFITEDSEMSPVERLLLGLGTLLAWINLVRYLEFDKKYTVLIAALQRGFPSALRFLLGTLPVFIGFALFGVAYFSETSSRFSSFGVACVTLFGLQNGDDVQGTFKETARNSIVSRIYLAVFIFISIYGVANIFIAIMDESYSMSIRQAENEKIKQKEQLAPSRESDLNNDDDLWTAVLGISKPKDSTINPPPSPRSPSPNLDDNDSGDDRDGDIGGEDESIENFMAFLDAQQAKFRQEMLSSLQAYTKTNKYKSNDNNTLPMKDSRKISFNLDGGSSKRSSPNNNNIKDRKSSFVSRPALSTFSSSDNDSDDDLFNNSPVGSSVPFTSPVPSSSSPPKSSNPPISSSPASTSNPLMPPIPNSSNPSPLIPTSSSIPSNPTNPNPPNSPNPPNPPNPPNLSNPSNPPNPPNPPIPNLPNLTDINPIDSDTSTNRTDAKTNFIINVFEGEEPVNKDDKSNESDQSSDE